MPGGAETKNWAEKYDQLPSHEAISEDQGTDQAGQMKRKDDRGHRAKIRTIYTETIFPKVGGVEGEVAIENEH